VEYCDVWTKDTALLTAVLTDFRAPLAEGASGGIGGSCHGIQGSFDRR